MNWRAEIDKIACNQKKICRLRHDLTVLTEEVAALDFVEDIVSLTYDEETNRLRINYRDRAGNIKQRNIIIPDNVLAPFFISVDPNFSLKERTIDITVLGEHFDYDTRFVFDTPLITINNINIIDPGRVVLTITIGDTGPNEVIYYLTAYNGNKISFPTPLAFTVTSATVLIPGTPETAWINLTGNVITGVGSIAAINPPGWNKEANFGIVPANSDFELEFFANVIYPNGLGVIGVSEFPLVSSDYNQIEYGLYIPAVGTVQIVESGVFYYGMGIIPSGSDNYKIKRENGVVTYYKGNTLIYTSSTVSNSEIYFDVSLYRNINLSDIKITYY